MSNTKDCVKQIKATFSRIREIEKAIFLEREEQTKEHYGINGMPKSQRLKDPPAQRTLKRLGPIQGVYLNDGTWVLYRPYDQQGYTTTYTIQCGKTVKMQTNWTQKGRYFLYELLRDQGILPNIERYTA